MLSWLKSLGLDFQRGMVTFLIPATGLGAWLLAKLKVFGGFVFELTNSKINISLALLLGALFYLLGRFNEKGNWSHLENPKILDRETVKVDTYEWRTKLLSDNTIEVGELPFCVKHDKKYIDAGFRFSCPTPDHTCVSLTDLFTAQQQAESIAESIYRKRRKSA